MTIQSASQLNASTYKVTYTGGVVVFVPASAGNTDYTNLQAWLTAGGTLS